MKDTHPLISVIIPCYNVEKYLDCCVQSIVDQTYTNLEIILVDDGSPDRVPAMCDEWSKKDSRIKVIHKPNGGLSDARNAGLDICSGDFVAFVDSDDFVDKNIYEKLLRALLDSGADIASCGFMRYINDEVKPYNFFKQEVPSKQYDSKQYLKAMLETRVSCASWNKLFKSSIFHDNRFCKGKYNEDILFFFYLLAHKKFSIVQIKDNCYYYRVTQNSVTTSFSRRNLDYLYNAQLFLELNVKENLGLGSSLSTYMNRVCSQVAWSIHKRKAKQEFVEEFEYCKRYLRRNVMKVLFDTNCKSMPYYLKIQSLIITIS